jgi:ribosomal protein S20
MANTRSSTKRAKQSKTKQHRNRINRSIAKKAVKVAVEAIQDKQIDSASLQDKYQQMVKLLSKAASKGAIPKKRAARKISRLTLLAKKVKPEFFSIKN